MYNVKTHQDIRNEKRRIENADGSVGKTETSAFYFICGTEHAFKYLHEFSSLRHSSKIRFQHAHAYDA